MQKHTTFVAPDDSKRTIVAGILWPRIPGTPYLILDLESTEE